ncbi:unnamed protein product, partial [Callosobruchus maculatus]
TAIIHFCRLRKPHREPLLKLKDWNIQVLTEHRILGVIFDSKLRWKAHINDVAVRCKKALNIIRCMSNLKWGADRDTLLSLYRSLVLSKM